jgi:hypothetical protein
VREYKDSTRRVGKAPARENMKVSIASNARLRPQRRPRPRLRGDFFATFRLTALKGICYDPQVLHSNFYQ